MREIDTIVVHCSATAPGWLADRPFADRIAAITRWHVIGNGWRAIGYHWLIDYDGAVAPGRPEAEVGAHVKGHNARSIGICLIGGKGSARTDRFADHFSPAQAAALRALLADLRTRYPGAQIVGHNDLAPRGCPGFAVADWLRAQHVPPARPGWGARMMMALGFRRVT
jgi:hypothetical protein